MKNYDEITNDLLKRRDDYLTQQKQKKKTIISIATPLVCFLLVALLGFGVWRRGVRTITPPNQPLGDPSYQVVSQETSQQEKEQESVVSVVSKIEGEKEESVVSKDTEKEPVETASKETSQPTASKVVEQPNEQENAEAVANPTPEFTTVTALQNWMLSKNDTDQFAQDKQDLLSTMATGNQIVYYRPTIDSGNDSLTLKKVTASHGVLRYYYEFTDEAYRDLEFSVSCYLDDSFKTNYLEAVKDLDNQVYGYICTNVNNHDVLYRDSQHGATIFLWQQFGGYIRASIKGENHADKVQEVLPYMNLEKVTLRTDLETQ